MNQSAVHELHFRDDRVPEAVKVELERKLMVLLEPLSPTGTLVFQGAGKVTGCRGRYSLSLDEVLAAGHLYTFQAESDWSGSGTEHDDYYLKSAESWFGYWTRGFEPVPSQGQDDPTMPRYRVVADKALRFESHLASPEDVQQEIVRRMKDGEVFSTSHKEGGTRMTLAPNGRYLRSDYGDDPGSESFRSESDFLAHLRRFYAAEVSRPTYPDQPDETTAWKLILRQLYRPNES